jgi:hypothetical protein
MSKCLILCHLGLGDNISMIGLCRYLCDYYQKIYIPSKEHNYKNVVSFFEDEPKIKVFITTDDKLRILPDIWNDFDIYNASLSHRNDFNIRAKLKLKDFEPSINTDNFLIKFYNKINLPFKIYYENFKLNSTDKSIELYNQIKNYNIIFIHETCSNKTFEVQSHLKVLNENDIIICSNRNYYTEGDKKNLAQLFVNIPIIDYITTIKNSNKIMTSDSCFSALIIPLKLRGDIKSNDITFFTRGN